MTHNVTAIQVLKVRMAFTSAHLLKLDISLSTIIVLIVGHCEFIKTSLTDMWAIKN